tara:strand:+ start:22 stop:729 length:708 start_codon:yes stop_codon:yes gene_type:complete
MRKILISGANSGIGLQIAHKELQEGNQISIGIRDTESIKGTILDPQKWQDGQLVVNKYDASDINTAKEWIRNSQNKFGGFDTLINCSGVLSRVPFIYRETEREEILNTITINFLSVWDLCKLCWENLSSSNNGRIITLVSMSGKRSKGNLAAYTSSKFALMGLCQTMRNVGWDQNIRVTAICPSWVNTKMANKVNSINKNEMSQPEDIAEICSMILKLPKQSVPFEILVNCNLEV